MCLVIVVYSALCCGFDDMIVLLGIASFSCFSVLIGCVLCLLLHDLCFELGLGQCFDLLLLGVLLACACGWLVIAFGCDVLVVLFYVYLVYT